MPILRIHSTATILLILLQFTQMFLIYHLYQENRRLTDQMQLLTTQLRDAITPIPISPVVYDYSNFDFYIKAAVIIGGTLIICYAITVTAGAVKTLFVVPNVTDIVLKSLGFYRTAVHTMDKYNTDIKIEFTTIGDREVAQIFVKAIDSNEFVAIDHIMLLVEQFAMNADRFSIELARSTTIDPTLVDAFSRLH